METVKGINKLLKKLDGLGKEAETGIDQIAEKVAGKIALDARSRAPKNLGTLSGSINYKKTGDLTYVVEVGESYGAYIEFGTGAKVQVPAEFQQMASRFRGQSLGTFEQGLQSIKDWCKAKGIEESAAYPIFISILRNGINPQPYFYPAFVNGREQFKKDLESLLKQLTK